MRRCYYCRDDVPSGVLVCDPCSERKQDTKVVGAVLRGPRGVGGARVYLSPEERKSIERLTGVPVWDAQDARAAIKAKGMRFLEKGEELDETLKRQEAGEKVDFPGWDRLGLMPKPKDFDFDSRLAFHRQRLGEN